MLKTSYGHCAYESVDVRGLFWVIFRRSTETSTPGLKGLYGCIKSIFFVRMRRFFLTSDTFHILFLYSPLKFQHAKNIIIKYIIKKAHKYIQ